MVFAVIAIWFAVMVFLIVKLALVARGDD
jgi:hypothetical protein